jgi:tetratricopeptide (TPR) repeat protein
MMRRLILIVIPIIAGCAAPQTQLGSVSQDQIAIEQARQEQFALEQILKQQMRVQNVANPLLRDAVTLCRTNIRPITGFVFGNAYGWKNDYRNAARAAGYGDTIVVLNVTTGLAADKAGLQVGDRILQVNGASVGIGDGAIEDLIRRLPNAKGLTSAAFALSIRRGADTTTVLVRPQMACSYSAQLVVSDDVNAYADGQTIYVTTGMLRFVNDDDELAVVLGHELGHNAMHHIDAQKKNALVGGLIGAIVDVAAATQGVNTHGDFTNQGAQLGSLVFSQDFEREADYVGLYILALAGKSLNDAPNLWRRMAVANPKSIKFAATHPTTAERFVRLDTWKGEIGRKIAAGVPLAPEMKNGANSFNSLGAPGESRAALASSSSNERKSAASSNAAAAAARIPDKASRSNRSDGQMTSAATTAPEGAREKTPQNVSPVDAPRPKGATATIGAPTTEADRLSAVTAFNEANRLMGGHEWIKAEAAYRETLLLDGSQANYHAALGKVLMVLRKYDEAEAEYTAAVLLDLDNAEYRRLVKLARSQH